MNDLFEASAPASPSLSPVGLPREDERPAVPKRQTLSSSFVALAARFSKIEAREEMREPWVSPDRTVSLLRILTEEFPDAWERCRVSEMIDRCRADHMVELVGSRVLAEKIADALRFPVAALQ